MLQMLDNLDTELEGIQLVLLWKLPNKGLALMISKGLMQTAKKEKQSKVQFSYKANGPQQ